MVISQTSNYDTLSSKPTSEEHMQNKLFKVYNRNDRMYMHYTVWLSDYDIRKFIVLLNNSTKN